MRKRKVPDIQALIFDLDGTAIPVSQNGMPSNYVKKNVALASEKIMVSVATGRSLYFCSYILDELEIRDVSILTGGAEIYDPVSKKYVWRQTLSKETIREVVGVLKKFSHPISDNTKANTMYSIDDYEPGEDITIMLLLGIPELDAQRICDVVTAVPGAEAHFMSSWTKGLCDVHITNELATKKHAMQALIAHEKLNHEHVMVVGDGGNDLPLFELAGWRVAMGNAHEKLKKAADWIAPNIDNDGLAVAIEKFILNK